ncbi:hydrogenase expression/formation protein HypE [Phosphitispora sp. TUW77]|uniref:hydrogenase expression/formation protein HypE n=1 Tax=Phosphitispora sp. TUW77 TaxID=3152361 RepID=UPI003AB61801
MDNKIRLSHGDGGSYTRQLIKNVFLKYFGEPCSGDMADSFVFYTDSGKLAFTTDSFVVKPLFFKGGDIGKLAVCGTINDLAAAGAVPLYLTAGFIIEEGFNIESLCRIAQSMAEVSRDTRARIVAGDTKVVEKGSVDGVFINTSGIGMVSELYNPRRMEPGDDIIVTGGIAEHGTAILIDRYNMNIEAELESDCGPMSSLLSVLNKHLAYIKVMRDPTRGGLATVLNEMALDRGTDIELDEKSIPIKSQVEGINDILGIDPLYLACEGRMVIVVEKGYGDKVLKHIKIFGNCREAAIIGRVASGTHGLVYINTAIGGKRILPMLEGRMLPRIC